ncbi:carnitine acetyltransferase [Lactarius pseudohatsudake]|nr:carnitine acetyltransferase [Lactarius pseudohatsudake]
MRTTLFHHVVFSTVKIRRPSVRMAPSGSLRAFSASTDRPALLPRLPVPELHQTLSKYLQSLIPLLQEDEAQGGASWRSALQERQLWADEFERGVGAKCQERLYALDKASPRNWLDDNIWLKKAYHEWRSPLLINSNWWLAFSNDDRIPEGVLREPPSFSKHIELNPWQVRRAAWLTYRHLEFKDNLARQEIYPNTTRTGLWFQETVAKTFSTCRIPQPHCDSLSTQPPRHSSNARKILVMVNDWTYTVEVYDESQTHLSVDTIERRLRGVVHDVVARIEAGEEPVPVGILSADDRDRWSENLQYILSLSAANQKSLEVVQQSIFAVSLDLHTLGFPSGRSTHTSHTLPVIDSPAEIDSHLHNIRSSVNARNRWFDKAYTLIVETNTRAGAMGEHSPCDALVPSIVADYAVVQSIVPEEFSRPEPAPFFVDHDPDAGGWERLDWVTDARIEAECIAAESRAKRLIADSDDSVLWFSDYGVEWITSIARLAPDAYIQMALQLAWYKSRGSFTATYETALTRAFDKARTETIRTLTEDSRAWVLSMTDPFASDATRLALLHRAVQTHTTLSRHAATGRGIDRHLLGLRLMMRPDAGERAALFEDPLFERSQEWKLSTSALSAGKFFRGTGFGAPYHDGYGINYLSGLDIIKFGIESKHSCAETSTATFQQEIASALREMRRVCSPEPTYPDAPIVARL